MREWCRRIFFDRYGPLVEQCRRLNGHADRHEGLSMGHLTSAEVLTALGLRALWKAPEWTLKVVLVIDAIRLRRDR